MLRIQHTEWPKGRQPLNKTNTIKEGGLCYSDQQQQLVDDARKIVRRKDEFKEFAKIFWVVLLGVSIFTALLILVVNEYAYQ